MGRKGLPDRLAPTLHSILSLPYPQPTGAELTPHHPSKASLPKGKRMGSVGVSQDPGVNWVQGSGLINPRLECSSHSRQTVGKN